MSHALQSGGVLALDDSIFATEIDAFMVITRSGPTNASVSAITKEHFVEVITNALTANAEPASWFSLAAGVVLILLGLMDVTDNWRLMRGKRNGADADEGFKKRVRCFRIQTSCKIAFGAGSLFFDGFAGRFSEVVAVDSDYGF